MRVFAFLPLLAGMAAAACFDNGDCLLTPHATCSKTAKAIVGTCVATGASGTTANAPTTTAGATCFDDGDCILSGGKCVKQKGKITGKCQKS